MVNIKFIDNNKIIITLILYFIAFYIIFNIRPTFLFNENGTFREFGAGYVKKTIIPPWFFTIILSIAIYLFVNFFIISIKIMFNNNEEN